MIDQPSTAGRRTVLLTLALLATMAAPPAAEAGHGRAPYYSKWASNGSYRYRSYNYYVPAYGSYRQHIAVYYPSRPRYVYYYEPYNGRYWGRYDLATAGYSTLAVADRKGNLAEIPDGAFPEPGAMPTPEGGEEPMLPPVETLPAGSQPAPPPASPRPNYAGPTRQGASCHGY